MELKRNRNRHLLQNKVRMQFSRDEIAAFYPHQAVMNAFSRAVRLAEIPVRFTEGFNAHPRIAIPYALSVGIAGEGETIEVELYDWMRPTDVRKSINRFLPRGLRVTRARLVPPIRAAYVVTGVNYFALLPEPYLSLAQEGVEKLRKADSFVVTRGHKKVKQVDIRKYLRDISLVDNRLDFSLKVTHKGTARPREIVDAVLSGCGVNVQLVPIFKKGLEILDAEH